MGQQFRRRASDKIPMENCPEPIRQLHGSIAICSTVRIADIQWEFHSASSALKDIRDDGMASGDVRYPYDIEGYLATLSQNMMAWILGNGSFPGGYCRLADVYSDIFDCPRQYYCLRIPQAAVLGILSCYPDEIREMITTRIFRHSVDYVVRSYIYDLDACAHIMLMMAISGSARAFYQSAGR